MSATPPTVGSPRGSEPDDLRRAAEAFEALLVQSLWRRMREANLEVGFFGDAAGASIYEGLFEQHLAESVVRRSPLGIADIVEARWRDRLESLDLERVLGAADAERGSRLYRDSLAAQVPGGRADE